MTTTEPHAALNHRCPFCHADPGQACRTDRGRGHALDHPHSRRIRMEHPLPETPRQHALCCKCGQLRTVSKNYSLGPTDENRGGGLFSDPRGWFHTGTLKCSHCDTRTRHALLEDEESVVRDLDEEYQRYVLGGKWDGWWAPDLERLRTEYFAQFPRNPFVNHRWWKSEEISARSAGKQWFRSMCGEMVPLPEQVRENGRDITAMEAPTHLTDPDRTREPRRRNRALVDRGRGVRQLPAGASRVATQAATDPAAHSTT